MKAFVSISFLLLFLIKGLAPGMDLCCELQKLPNLMEHYQEYKIRTGPSFWEFFAEHYLQGDPPSQGPQEDAEHEELPFHGKQQCCQAVVFHNTQHIIAIPAPESDWQIAYSAYRFSPPSGYPESRFQPPQL